MPKPMPRSDLALLLALCFVSRATAQIMNGGFDSDLTGWTASTGVSYGTLGEDGIALFIEDAFRTTPVLIEQAFMLSADQDTLTFEFGARDAFLPDSALTPPGVFAVFLFDGEGQPVGTTDYQFGIQDALFVRDIDTKSHFGGPLPFNSVCLDRRGLLRMAIDVRALMEDTFTLKVGAFDGGGGILETYLDNVALLTRPDPNPAIRLQEDFETRPPGPWAPNSCDAWGAEWHEYTKQGIDGISVRNTEATWEFGNWAGSSDAFIPMFGRLEFDISCTVPFNFYSVAHGAGADTVVKFQPDGSLALFDYSPAVFSWVETPPGIWTPGEPLRLGVETYTDRREVFVNGGMLLSGMKDEFFQGVGVERFFFRYGNDLSDNSGTFGPGSLMIDNVLVTRRADFNTIPAIGNIGAGMTFLVLLASGVLVIKRQQQHAQGGP